MIRPTFHPRITLTAAAAAVAVMLGACDRRATEQPATPTPAVTQSHTRGQVTITLTLDRREITIADRATLTLTIDAPADTPADWSPPASGPDGEPATLGDFTLAIAHTRTLDAPPGRTRTEHTLLLEPFLDGEKTIPPITIAADPASGLLITTEPITVEVRPVLPPSSQQAAAPNEPLPLAPIREPLSVELPESAPSPLLPVAAATLCAAWAGAFALAHITARRRRPAQPPLTPSARLAAARAALSAAQADPFGPPAANLSTIPAQITLALRQHLAARFDIPAAGATPAELAPRIAALPVPGQLSAALIATLARLEQAAFAPSHPRTADLAEDLNIAERFIAETSNPSKEAAA